MEATNTQPKPGPFEDSIKEKEMIPGGYNRQRDASNNQLDLGSVEGTLEEKLFPGGWNDQMETSNTEYYPDPVQSALEKKEMIPGGWNCQR